MTCCLLLSSYTKKKLRITRYVTATLHDFNLERFRSRVKYTLLPYTSKQYSTLQYDTLHFDTVRYNKLQDTIMQHSYNSLQYTIVQ